MVSLHEEEKPNRKIKETTRHRVPKLIGTPKSTSHWWVCYCAVNCGCTLLCLASRFEAGSEAVRWNFEFILFKIQYPVIWRCCLALSSKMSFRMVYKAAFFYSRYYNCPDLYLNSTYFSDTVPKFTAQSVVLWSQMIWLNNKPFFE